MSNVPTTQASGDAVATADDYNPFAAYGEQATGGARNIIKFRKGRFFFGQDDIEIPLGTRLIAKMANPIYQLIRTRLHMCAQRNPLIRNRNDEAGASVASTILS